MGVEKYEVFYGIIIPLGFIRNSCRGLFDVIDIRVGRYLGFRVLMSKNEKRSRQFFVKIISHSNYFFSSQV